MSAASLWSNPSRFATFAVDVGLRPLPQPLARATLPVRIIHVQDGELVNRCLAGDGAAWEEVVRLHSRRVYNLCFRFTGRASDAEDLAQDVFVRLFRNLASYRAEAGSLATWLTTLTRNLLIDHYRRAKPDRMTDALETENDQGERVEMPLEARGRTAEQQVWGREVQEQVQRALLKLSPELREAVILRDLQDLDYKEIAAVMRIPEGTVKSRINRGRIELARLLRPSLGTAGSNG